MPYANQRHIDILTQDLYSRLEQTRRETEDLAAAVDYIRRGQVPVLRITPFTRMGKDLTASYVEDEATVRICGGRVFSPGGVEYTDNGTSATGVSVSSGCYLVAFGGSNITTDIYLWIKINTAAGSTGFELITTTVDNVTGDGDYNDDDFVFVPIIKLSWNNTTKQLKQSSEIHYHRGGDIYLDGVGDTIVFDADTASAVVPVIKTVGANPTAGAHVGEVGLYDSWNWPVDSLVMGYASVDSNGAGDLAWTLVDSDDAAAREGGDQRSIQVEASYNKLQLFEFESPTDPGTSTLANTDRILIRQTLGASGVGPDLRYQTIADFITDWADTIIATGLSGAGIQHSKLKASDNTITDTPLNWANNEQHDDRYWVHYNAGAVIDNKSFWNSGDLVTSFFYLLDGAGTGQDANNYWSLSQFGVGPSGAVVVAAGTTLNMNSVGTMQIESSSSDVEYRAAADHEFITGRIQVSATDLAIGSATGSIATAGGLDVAQGIYAIKGGALYAGYFNNGAIYAELAGTQYGVTASDINTTTGYYVSGTPGVDETSWIDKGIVTGTDISVYSIKVLDSTGTQIEIDVLGRVSV